jgi:serine/threonine-protein kinase
MASPLGPGTVIAGRYRLDRLLGEGGMGQVWSATHAVTQRTVALKFLKASSHMQPELRRRFVREARAASAVKHPNVVEIHDFFELDDGTPVMMMDLLQGETFGQRLSREHALSLKDTVDILLPVTSAVGTAHALGIVHRDLKPDNVFLCAGRHTEIKVLDFGIAKLTGADDTGADAGNLTDTGAVLGTPCYMSPEQSFGERDLDHRSDIWAIGVMLYEALSGTRPVDGDNIGQVIKRLLNEGITPIEVLVPDLPPDVAALVGRMLCRERAGRPEDLREVHDALAPHGSVRVPEFGAAVSVRPISDSHPGAASRPTPTRPDRPGRLDPRGDTLAQAPPTLSEGVHFVPGFVSSPLPPGDGPQTQGAQSVSVGRPPRRRGAWMLGAGAALAAAAVGVLRLSSHATEGAATAGVGAARAAAPEAPSAAPARIEPTSPTTVIHAPDAGLAAAPERSAGPAAATPAHAARPGVKADHPRAGPPVATAATAAPPPPSPAPAAAPRAPARARGLVDEPPF